ncbi:hypothetical protein CK510_30025 [Brunnivagina elsteri CCALA 953]|uniref:Uncharacterized protein n=2 Tax=Brunnivagina TaxID=3344733 RepID=A0A2A2TAM6_9CYAN|nr:hypothetical protein CK510_30025 [Calothrix elsteri CCALA 953]
MFWVLVATQASFAQVNFANQQANNSQFDAAGLLPVPKLPAASNQATSGLIAVPPPGESLSNQVPTASNSFASSNSVMKPELSSSQNINQLENSFIYQGRQGKKATSHTSQAFTAKKQNLTNSSTIGSIYLSSFSVYVIILWSIYIK